MDFQFELERIVSPKTKEYIQDTINCYNDHNYRSAINSLYSVMFVDLIEKITVLATLYDDEKANKILIDAKKDITDDNWIPWEGEFLKKLHKTPILNSETLYQTALELKKWRNFSSHPSINDFGAVLETPDRYLVAHFFQVLFNQLFTVTPTLIGNITDKFLDFLAEKQDLLSENSDKLELYLKDSFLNKLAEKQKNELVKSMFKFVFIKKSSEFEKNRYINFQAFCVILEMNLDIYTTLLLNDKELINKVDLSESDDRSFYFENLIEKHNQLYRILTETQKDILEEHFQKNLGKYLIYPFVINSNDYSKRISEIKQKTTSNTSIKPNFTLLSIDNKIEKEDMQNLIEHFKLMNAANDFHNFIIYLFSGSSSFQEAKQIYLNNISLILNDLNKDNWEYLLNTVNQNDQIYHSFDVNTSAILKSYADYLKNNQHNNTKNIEDILMDLKNKYTNMS